MALAMCFYLATERDLAEFVVELPDPRAITQSGERDGGRVIAGATTGCELQRELDTNQCPFAGRAAELERSAQGLRPVAEADQARAAGGIGAARAVVANRQVQAVVPFLDRDAH